MSFGTLQGLPGLLLCQTTSNEFWPDLAGETSRPTPRFSPPGSRHSSASRLRNNQGQMIRLGTLARRGAGTPADPVSLMRYKHVRCPTALTGKHFTGHKFRGQGVALMQKLAGQGNCRARWRLPGNRADLPANSRRGNTAIYVFALAVVVSSSWCWRAQYESWSAAAWRSSWVVPMWPASARSSV